MSNSSVPPPTWGPEGFIIPEEAEVLAGIQADMNAAFGGDLNPALETPQGQLASSMAALVASANDTFLYFTNQVDPAYAVGRMQDGIARIYFIERNPAEPTVVVATLTGVVGTVIPAGTQALATDGNIYYCTQAGTIQSGGSVDLSFACAITGPIACPAGSLNTIYQALTGWDTITNHADGVIGSDVESRAAFEARRIQSVAINSIGSLPSVLAAVLSVPDVLDAKVVENNLGTNATILGVNLVPHSIYVSVAGGLAADVAKAIWTKKAPGCDYNGNTTVVVEDRSAHYAPPYPSYSVKFQTPVALPIKFAVKIANNASVPADAATQIKAAITAAFTGADGGSRARIGSTIYASRYYPGVAALGAWAQVISILIGTVTADQTSVVVNLDKVPTVAPADIVVTLV